jgi:hypothetical protein
MAGGGHGDKRRYDEYAKSVCRGFGKFSDGKLRRDRMCGARGCSCLLSWSLASPSLR